MFEILLKLRNKKKLRIKHLRDAQTRFFDIPTALGILRCQVKEQNAATANKTKTKKSHDVHQLCYYSSYLIHINITLLKQQEQQHTPLIKFHSISKYILIFPIVCE